MYPSHADLHEATWDEVVTVEVWDGIVGCWFQTSDDFKSADEAHKQYDNSGVRYRVVVTHYRNDDLR